MPRNFILEAKKFQEILSQELYDYALKLRNLRSTTLPEELELRNLSAIILPQKNTINNLSSGTYLKQTLANRTLQN